MTDFKLDKEKAKATLLYIARKVGKIDFHKAFKILYFAEQQHLVNYGRPIIGDDYVAMPNGPVPSFLYDALKYAGKPLIYNEIFESISKSISVEGCIFTAIEEPDLDELSKSDIICLEKSIKDNCFKSFKKLTDESHDSAWNATQTNRIMDYTKIAIAGGADSDMLKYIKENIENTNIEFAS